jgi:putative transposase
MSAAFGELRAVGVRTKAACGLIGRSRASHYRHLLGPVHGPRPPRKVPGNGQALTVVERDAVLTLINSTGYGDLSIGQVWTRELDEGRYLCSMSTMYRIARAAGQSRERRRQADASGEGETRTVLTGRPRCGRGTSRNSVVRRRACTSTCTC